MNDRPDNGAFWRKYRIVFCGKWLIAGFIALMSIILIYVCYVQRSEIGAIWKWLSSVESGSATLRNIGLIVLASIALPFAIWRSVVAGRQVDIAQRGLRNERYQKAVEMLGDEILTVRLGGIYALQSLVKEDPSQYHSQIMRIFCSFLRWPTQITRNTDEVGIENVDSLDRKSIVRADSVRADVEQVVRAIGTRRKKEVELEINSDSKLAIYDANLHGLDIRDKTGFPVDASSIESTESARKSGSNQANLSHIHFQRVDFSSADLYGADMSHSVFWDPKFNSAKCVGVDFSSSMWEGGTLHGAEFYSAKLSKAQIIETDLSTANLTGADLSDVIFEDVNLSGVVLRNANLSGTCFSMALYKNALFSRAGFKYIDGEIEEFRAGVRNLTQGQIDEATADASNPPLLEGVVDCNTGKQLVWKGRAT